MLGAYLDLAASAFANAVLGFGPRFLAGSNRPFLINSASVQLPRRMFSAAMRTH